MASNNVRFPWSLIWKLVRPRCWALVAGLIFILLNRVAGLVLPAAGKLLIDDVVLRHEHNKLGVILVAVLSGILVQIVTIALISYTISGPAQELVAQLRMDVFSHITYLPVSYYDSHTTGTLVARIMSDVESVRHFLDLGLVNFIGGILTSLIAAIVMLDLNARMTCCVLLCVAVFVTILKPAFVRMQRVCSDHASTRAQVTGRLTESLGGVRTVKVYRAEIHEINVFRDGVLRLLSSVLRQIKISSVVSIASSCAIGTIGLLIMYMGGRQAALGMMTIGEFVTYWLFVGYLIGPMFQVVSLGIQMNEAIAGLQRTYEVFSVVPEPPARDGQQLLGSVAGMLTFHNVSFGYRPEKLVLKGVSFAAEPGTVTALVGHSGAGKSTMVGLIAGLYHPDVGKVCIDGIDLECIALESYRRQFAIVLQDCFLFDGTIRDNILLARPCASESEMDEVCSAAHVDDFVRSLPDAYDTLVGERGIRLSGGQKQRVAIARALLANARVLVLDEATSNIDCESEALIKEGLARLMRGRTAIVIAHRLSTIRGADQILMIEDGRIVERGRHEELYNRRGRYHSLYMRHYADEWRTSRVADQVQM